LPGWGRTPFRSAGRRLTEFLVGHRPSFGDFAPGATRCSAPGSDPHVTIPSHALATFPAVDGRPTVVIGSAELTASPRRRGS
jgi:hypothetical protein